MIGRSGVVLYRWPRTIRRQLQHRRRFRQIVAPISKLLLENVPLQPVALPHRIIRILGRKIRQRRWPARDKSFVQSRKFADQNIRRPAIGHDVMQRDRHNMLALSGRRAQSKIQQEHPQQRTRRQIERPTRLLAGQAPRLRLPLLYIETAQIHYRRRNLQRRRDLLPRLSVAHHDGSAKNLMPAHDLVDRGRKRRNVQIANQTQGRRKVVGCISRLELVQEPQTLLRKRKRQSP